MKTFFTAFIIFSLSHFVYAQETKLETSTISFGYSNQNKPITATQYTFPYLLHTYIVDTSKNQLIAISLSGTNAENAVSHIYVASLATLNILWSQKVPDNNIILYSDEIFARYHDETYCYDQTTGQIKWGSVKILQVISNVHHLARVKNGIAMFDSSNGGLLWRVDTKEEIPVLEDNNIQQVNDSVIAIISADIYGINTYNGNHWKNTDTRLTNVAVGKGWLSLSTKNKLLCMDAQGEMKWEKPVANGNASVGYIFNCGERIVQVNYGWIIHKKKKVKTGQPFLAAYDAQTGDEQYKIFVDDTTWVEDFTLNSDTILLKTGNKLFKYNAFSGDKIATVNVIGTPLADFHDFASTNKCVLAYSDSDMRYVNNIYPGCYFMIDEDKNILVLDASLHKKDIIRRGQYFFSYATNDKYTLLAKGELLHIFLNNKKIASFPDKDRQFVLWNNMFYKAYNNKIVAVDLHGLQ